MTIFKESELDRVTTITELNYTNPFLPRRIELLRHLLGDRYVHHGDVWSRSVKLIDLEKELNNAFEDRTINEKRLNDLLEEIAETYKALRYVHLSTHLKTPHILTTFQIENYNKLRGYFSEDPCENIPKGHDPEMWKKHHNSGS